MWLVSALVTLRLASSVTGGGMPKSTSRTPRAVRTMRRTGATIPSATTDGITILISEVSAGRLTYGAIELPGDTISRSQNHAALRAIRCRLRSPR